MGSESEITVKKAEFAIGIDLGTTYSCVGIWRSDRVEIIGQDQTKHTPSCVAFYEEEDEGKHIPKRLIGEAAVNEDECSTANIIYDSKRLIGRRFSEKTVQSDIEMWPFTVIPGDDDKPMISVTCENLGVTKNFSPEEISAMILRRLKETVEEFLSTEKIKVKVEDAVITVPAYFDQSQRQATIEAGKIAGLNVLRLLNEPTAAAVAYTLNILEENKNNLAAVEKKKNVLVFDLGGGTFDVSCLTVTNNKIEVKAVGGDSHLGGQDFVNRMVDHFVEVFKTEHKEDISKGKALRKLRKACEITKRSLSSSTSAHIYIEGRKKKITREIFETVNSDLFDKCMEGVEKCLIEAKMDKKDVDEVVLIGGSSKIPKIQELLRELMNGKELYKSIDPFEAVASGAAVQAALLSGRGSGKIKDLMLVDVTPLSLGVQTVGEVMSVIIPKNTSIPTRAERTYTTIRDNQTAIKFPVYEGERAKSKDNKLLGELTLSGIKPALRGVPSVDVSFNLQCDGILEVTAKDRGTGQAISTSIKSMKLSGEDIQRMKKEADEYGESDAMFRKKGEARHSFDNYICKLRNEIKSENMKAEGKKKAEKAVEEAFQWLDSQGERLAEVSEYEERKNKLMSVMDEARRN